MTPDVTPSPCKREQTMDKFQWDDDPLYFFFRNDIPGKVKMHTKRLDLKDWITIDRTYPDQMYLRQKLEKEKSEFIFLSNDDLSTSAAKIELLQLVFDHLPERFPDKFEKTESGIYNKVLDTHVSSDPNDPLDPLIRIGRLTQEDWCILEWSEEHRAYILTAGIVCFPMKWSLQEKWNQPMMQIHRTVDAYTKNLLNLVNDLFAKMPPAVPMYRGNWAIFNDVKDPLDLFTPKGHNKDNKFVSIYKGEQTGKEVILRTEYQTLRKLAGSKAIAFGIRSYQRYLAEFKSLPRSDTEALIKAVENLDEDSYVYKEADLWIDATLKYLKFDVLQQPDPDNFFKAKQWILPTVGALVGGLLLVGLIVRRSLKA